MNEERVSQGRPFQASRASNEDTLVVLRGRKFSVSVLKENLKLGMLAERPAILRVLKVLYDTDIPLTRSEIAEKSGRSTVQTSGVLKELLDVGFVARMKLAKQTIMYALTEKGYELAKEKFEMKTEH